MHAQHPYQASGRPESFCSFATQASRTLHADFMPVHYWCYRVPCIQFQTLFTLISKYFSSFPHGTCSLSVSQPYLALDEIYHPFNARIPTNMTRKNRLTTQHRPPVTYGIITLYDAKFLKTYTGKAWSPRRPHKLQLDVAVMAAQIENLSFTRFTRRY